MDRFCRQPLPCSQAEDNRAQRIARLNSDIAHARRQAQWKIVMFADAIRIGPLVRTSRGGGDQSSSLTERLEEFYNTTEEYTAFNAPSDQETWLRIVANEIKHKSQRIQTKVRVLEAGA